MSDKDFKNKLDELIKVFKRLKEKDHFKNIINNNAQLKNIEMLINNYDFIKNNISEDMLEDIGENIKSLIIDLTNQLKQELGEAGTTESKESADDIGMIDSILTKDNLSENKINELLDKRNSLNN